MADGSKMHTRRSRRFAHSTPLLRLCPLGKCAIGCSTVLNVTTDAPRWLPTVMPGGLQNLLQPTNLFLYDLNDDPAESNL
jgi:hypothetical protein